VQRAQTSAIAKASNINLHLNPDFWINQDSDLGACRIVPKMLWIHYLVGVSHFAECRKISR